MGSHDRRNRPKLLVLLTVAHMAMKLRRLCERKIRYEIQTDESYKLPLRIPTEMLFE